jgi:hypothetical protein
MPYYEMRDAFGSMYRLSTMSRETAQRWFDEWLPRLFRAEDPADMRSPLMLVWPMPTEDGKSCDWAADTRFISEPFYIPRDPAQALAAIDRRREFIEEQVRLAHANGK